MKYYYLTDNSERSLTPFFSKLVLSAGFTSVVIVSILVLIFWPRQPLADFMIANKIPLGFFLVSGAVLIVYGYVNLSCGGGEMIARHYFVRYRTDVTTFEKEIDFLRYGLIEFLLHTLILLLPFLPLLILGASISVASIVSLFKVVCIVYTGALLFRLFGFMAYLLWGRLSSLGYFTGRLFMVVFVFGTLIFLPQINPLHVLYDLNEYPGAFAWQFVLYMGFVVFAILLLIAANHKLVRRHINQEKTK